MAAFVSSHIALTVLEIFRVVARGGQTFLVMRGVFITVWSLKKTSSWEKVFIGRHICFTFAHNNTAWELNQLTTEVLSSRSFQTVIHQARCSVGIIWRVIKKVLNKDLERYSCEDARCREGGLCQTSN